MRTLLIMTLMFAGLLLQAQPTYDFKPCYLVVIEKGMDEPIIRKPRTIKQLDNVIKLYYPKSTIDIAEFMQGSTSFEIWRHDFRFYVEMKRITKKGKFRKLRRKDIRKIERL